MIDRVQRMARLRTAAVAVLLLGMCSGALEAAGESAPVCDRTCLEKTLSLYVAAVVRHDASTLSFTNDFRATENGVALKVGEGSWKTLQSFKSQPQFVTDVDAQEVAYVGVVEDAGQPAFYALRLKLKQGRIDEAESILSHDGESGPAFEPQGFIYREAPYIREVPSAHRSSRSELVKVANQYWDVSSSSHRGETLPYSTDCWHFENGMNTDWERPFMPEELVKPDAPENQAQDFDGRIWTCAREAILTTASWQSAHDRHYLLDEARGLVFNIVYVDVGARSSLRGPVPPAGAAAAAAAAGPPGGPSAAAPNPIEGPGGRPLGMSDAGMRTAMAGTPYTMAHFEVMRVVGGKITREQDVMRVVPDNAKRPFG